MWCASVPALPGCHTWGDSYEHLLEMLQDSIQVCLEVASQREDQLDLASFSLQYAASIFPESEETA
ncbi:type II toxin-antitoxin system HicB family antitoxin [Nostoc sp.]|uniref:type II toxin-antitoxin system HicB family antitoxin n=1 Tax=Nostoc sp. TaxID=1180 RepID=UPI002FF87BB5